LVECSHHHLSRVVLILHYIQERPIPSGETEQKVWRRSIKWFVRSSDSRVAASMPCEKTPALKPGRRRGNEVTDEGQTERMERRRGSRDSASATDLGMRMVTRGRKKMMEALVRE
ncbi:hypothetical protein T06_12794, partial [Trichinella sp. T6]